MSFKQHFDMISMHEPVTRKAKFWQSYVAALKGTTDMRADDHKYGATPRSARAMSEFPEFFTKSIADEYSPYSDSSAPSHRIYAPGYRYLPISRETYGYSPRAIYGYDRPPSRYEGRPRAVSVPPMMHSGLTDPWYDSPAAYYPRASSVAPFRAPSMAREMSRARSPSPASSLAGPNYRKLYDMLNPDPYRPISSFTRAPWWYDLASPLKPIDYYPRRILSYPSLLRSSYLSPVRNSYVWSRHPLRHL